jgi:NAD(P)H-nitrite reductase large subunit
MTGTRPIRVFFTKQLLQLIDGNGLLPMRNPVIIGSDLIGYAAAAKLKVAGAEDAIIMDKQHRPECSFFERLYFRIWSKPRFRAVNVKSVEVMGSKTATGIRLSKDGDILPCDGIVVCGELIPNSELALLGKLKIELPSRKPVIGRDYQMSESGWFSAGNMLGGFRGAEWCYFNGRRVARSVMNYLSKSI